MTSPANEQGGQQIGLRNAAPLRQTVIDAIDEYLVDGMGVYDVNGEKVGDVKMHSMAAGYLMVGHGPMELYIPFRLIRSIDPHDIFLTEDRDTLVSSYTEPPTVSIVVENRLVPGPHGTMTTQTRQVQVVESGYDGTPVEIESIDVGSVAERLAVGMIVYDVNGERLGDLTDYDVGRSLMVVEKGIFRSRVLFVPFSAIQEIHPSRFIVYLSLPRAVLMKEHAMLPADAADAADAVLPEDT